MLTDGYAVSMVDYFVPSEQDWLPLLKGNLARTGHACEQEVALTLALTDDAKGEVIVAKIKDLAPRLTQPWMPADVQQDPISQYGAGWAAIFQADDCGYFGEPQAASKANGEFILEATVAGLAKYLDAFATTPLRLGTTRDKQQPNYAAPLPTLK
jgi:creatinine amidohydrolase